MADTGAAPQADDQQSVPGTAGCFLPCSTDRQQQQAIIVKTTGFTIGLRHVLGEKCTKHRLQQVT